jgi:hypothetical protein
MLTKLRIPVLKKQRFAELRVNEDDFNLQGWYLLRMPGVSLLKANQCIVME